mmetsp:Transcript_15206/g.19842  ORF Transcript_15206/g.19842 Transcript_15206/m.19842 type:complete len:360 (+) Transcript_15206:559-1638(+)|eukprot:CAMPEP_0116063830 /NCGR_PEP_ID=MMETSP0322-20121206/8686_1 /TAXON_ID=163516 /ORGANISM="Leptocylindrus danicus var. apora, Strain B651" /LENGTH=359 /DNA_ID=CAMNT_0003549599 /DNA_START=492 /DNA_END=1571 /DNA_ORIENTATION=-
MGTHYQHHETKQEVPSYNTNLNGMITTTTTDAKTNAQEQQHQQQHSSEQQKKQSDAEIMIEAINALCRNASYSCLGAVATFEEPLKLPPSAVDDRCDDDMDVEVMISSDDKSNGGGGWSRCDREKGGFMKKRKKKSNLVRDPVYSKKSNDLDVSVESSKDWMDVGAPITSNSRSSSAPSLLNAGTASSIDDSFDENRHLNDASRRNVNLTGFGDVMWHEDNNNGAMQSGSICGKMPRRSSLSTNDLIEMKNNLQKRQRRRVSLVRAVSVVPIPSRTEYPDAVRSAIWSSPVEMYQNAARNSIEFAAEGWNWRTVYDDDTMCLNSENGELVHPIHYYLNNLDGVDAYSPPAVDNSCATKA